MWYVHYAGAAVGYSSASIAYSGVRYVYYANVAVGYSSDQIAYSSVLHVGYTGVVADGSYYNRLE